MIRKLSKQHILGLALTVVGVCVFLGIQLTDIANQKTYASWSSNDDWIDNDFWAISPNTGDIINALFGDGNGGADLSFYTRYRQTNTCNIATMNIVYLNPGTNTIPATLSGNTVYVLLEGSYDMHYTITINQDCTAMIGEKVVSSSEGPRVSFYGTLQTGIQIENTQNIILAGMLIQDNGSIPVGIDLHNVNNSTTNVQELRYFDIGTFLDDSDHNFIADAQLAGDVGCDVTNGSEYNTLGGNVMQNSIAGWRIINSDNNTFKGSLARNNYNNSKGYYVTNSNHIIFMGYVKAHVNDGRGIYIEDSNDVVFDGFETKWNNGGEDKPAITLIRSYSGTINNGNIAQNNAGGLYLEDSSGITLYNVSLNNNTSGDALSIQNSSGIQIDTSVISGNSDNGLYISQSTGVVAKNTTIQGNQQNGIIAIDTNDVGLYNNIIATNIQNGLHTSGGTTAHIYTGNIITGNTINGIYWKAGNTILGYNIIDSNTISSNSGVGIKMEGNGSQLTNNTIKNNNISDNTEDGIYMWQGFVNILDMNNIYNNGENGIYLYQSINNKITNQDIYANHNNGILMSGSSYITITGTKIKDNQDHGISMHMGQYNILENLLSFGNGQDGLYMYSSLYNTVQQYIASHNTNNGITLDFASTGNDFFYIQSYNNASVGIDVQDIQSTENMFTDILIYNNGNNIYSYAYNTFNNAAVFNGSKGITLYGPHNTINNANIYNNQHGVTILDSSSNNNINATTIYNNDIGIRIGLMSSGNTYNGLTLFANDTNLQGTNGADGLLTLTSYARSSGMLNTLSGSDIMTCDRVIQATNQVGSNLLQYPYCNTRYKIQSFMDTSYVQYTYFPYIRKQTLPVAYTLPLPNIVTTGTANSGVFIGDFVYSGSTQFAGNMTLANEGTTFASGGFTYRYDNGPFDIIMNSDTDTTKGFVVTGVNDVLRNGVVGSIGSFAGLQYPLLAQYLAAGDGLKIFRAAYDIGGSGLISNYYGQIRGIHAPVCGDTVIEYTEQCDDGNISPNDGCSDTCQIELWNCAWFSGRTTSGYMPHSTMLSVISGLSLSPYTFGDIIWGDNTTNGAISGNNTHVYQTGGNYTGSIQVTTQFTPLSAQISTCYFPVTTSVPPYCGDGTRQTPNASGFNEQCDLGVANGNGTSGCSSLCTYETPSCTVSTDVSSGYTPLDVNILPVYTNGELSYINYGDGSTGLTTSHIYSNTGTYTMTLYTTNPLSGDIISTCTSQIQINAVPYCGDEIRQTPNASGFNEQCDDGNTDDYDGCSSQCIVNVCTTTIINTIDPLIVYQRGTIVHIPTSGMLFTFTTPTTGVNYTYQRSLSGIDMSTISGMQFSGSNTGIIAQVYVSADQVPATFSGVVTLEVGNGVITGSIDGILVCEYGNCQFVWADYELNSVGGLTTYGDYHVSVVNQNIINNPYVPNILYAYQVKTYPMPVDIRVDIYTCDINQWVVDADAAGLFNTGGLTGFTSGDFLNLYNSGALPSMYHITCTTGDYPWQGGLYNGTVAYILGYNGGNNALGTQSQDFGNYTYILNSGSSTDIISRDSGLSGGYIRPNNVGIQYTNSCINRCGNYILEPIINEQCDDGNLIDGDGCSSQCTFEIPQICGLSGNLVPNPGFESYLQCPTSYAQFSGYIASWQTPSIDPDYARLGCAYGTGFFDTMQQQPYEGSGAVNILTYSSNMSAGREYIGAELISPMQTGNYYDVGFCYATHRGSKYITDRIGMLFSTGASPTNTRWNAITETPQFEHIGYVQGSGRTCVSGTVYADKAYERFLIGSFHTNTGQNMIPNPNYQTGYGPIGYDIANYVIDDVFVSKSCIACGNGVVDTGTNEQCDDRNLNNNDTCNAQCQRSQPTCALLLTPSAGNYPLNVLFSLNMSPGSSLIHMNYGDGTTGLVITGHTYTTGGLFTPVAYIQNTSNTGLTAICAANTAITVSRGYVPVCGNGVVDTGTNEQCDGGSNCTASCTIKSSGGGGGGGGSSSIRKDDCDGNDASPSYYDGTCEGTPQHAAAPVGRACKYNDEQYLARGPFTDTLRHRALQYTEMMRASCMWRGRDTGIGQWRANPDENITVAEVLKTFVKIEGIAFNDFTIKTENAKYPKAIQFADVSQDHWFARYAEYAVKKGLTNGLVTIKNGKQYLDPDKHITRNDALKLMMIVYDAINKKKVNINGESVLGDVVNASDPYYQYIRKAEALGFISGVKQKDGTYRFDGKRPITRAEFAKIVSVPFNDQLFDTSALVLNSPVYRAIVKALDVVRGDKIDFVNTLLFNMGNISDMQFIKKFKVTKAIFIQEIRNAILPGLYEDAGE